MLDMRTTITVQDGVMRDVIRLSRTKTKTAAVNFALNDWVRLKRVQKLRALRGKLEVADDLADLRKLEMSEG
jgi:Arc/MetJ family transcription regulator